VHVDFATAPGVAGRINEDWVGACPTAAVVLDGVTAPGGMSTGCRHGVPWYVRQLGSHVLGEAARNPDVALADCLGVAIDSTARAHAETCNLSDPGTPSATVAMLRFTQDLFEYLVLSDATIVLDTITGLDIITDQSVSDFAASQRKALHQTRPGTPEHDELLRDLVSEQRRYRNQPGGYWLAASDPSASAHATTGSMPLSALQRAALVSDGASAIVDTYRVWTWVEFLDALDRTGSSRTLAAVRETEAEDPDGSRWPRYKASDDASVLLFAPWGPGREEHPGVPG
jgi:hypothetical protein